MLRQRFLAWAELAQEAREAKEYRATEGFGRKRATVQHLLRVTEWSHLALARYYFQGWSRRARGRVQLHFELVGTCRYSSSTSTLLAVQIWM